MTRGRLVWANLMRHKWRTILTTASVAVAMFLFASLRSFGTTLDALSSFGAANRMIVRHKTAIVFTLPPEVRGNATLTDHLRALGAGACIDDEPRSDAAAIIESLLQARAAAASQKPNVA